MEHSNTWIVIYEYTVQIYLSILPRFILVSESTNHYAAVVRVREANLSKILGVTVAGAPESWERVAAG